MDEADIARILALLRDQHIELQPGLTDAEVARVEQTYGFRFPPDLRALLQAALPVGPGFVDWRNGEEEGLQSRLDWPVDGICFDIQYNGFWMTGWGPRPADLETAIASARQAVAQAPVLIPVYTHRYLPDDPPLAGNPVFSVYQTDIIYYGQDLVTYFTNEFAPQHPLIVSAPARVIRFWSQLAS